MSAKELLKPSIIRSTDELGPEKGADIAEYLFMIKDQSWFPHDEPATARLTYALEELRIEDGRVQPIERYIVYTLYHSISVLQQDVDQKQPRHDIDEFIGKGLSILDEMNPKKASLLRDMMDRIKDYPPR
jgi:hypothetical protein